MSTAEVHPPALVPALSRGKHRSARQGACFMEMASYLAGERWSDHPACTHPLLASLARHVNDLTSDAGRSRLAPLIPSVIGRTSDDPRVDVRIALLSAVAALPVVSERRQRVLGVALLTCERLLAELPPLEPGAGDRLAAAARAARAQAPLAAVWAEGFAGESRTSPQAYRRRAAPHVISYAALGIAEACVADPDTLLHDLLATVVADSEGWAPRGAQPASRSRRRWEAQASGSGLSSPATRHSEPVHSVSW